MKKLQTNPASRLILLAIIFSCTVIVSSCTKTNNDPANKKFIGTYNGTNCAGTSETKILNAGSDNNSVTLPSNMGSGSCAKNFDVVATVNGNNLVIASQSFTDNCGTVTLTVSGTGTISGNTLTLSLAESETSGGSTVTGTECFSGTK